MNLWTARAEVDIRERLCSIMYARKFAEKITVASELIFGLNKRDFSLILGYDYKSRTARVRGALSHNCVVTALVESKLCEGLDFIVSGEIDHKKYDYKFGFGLRANP